MKLEIPYGDTIESIELADGNIEQVIIPNTVQTADEAKTLKSAISNPLESPGLEEFLEGRKNILILVNDATRPTPTGAVMGILHPLLRDKNFKILIATGSHRAPTDEEYDFIFGKLYGEVKDRVHVHDAKKSPCYSLGKTLHGNDLMLNTLVREADAIIPIGSIEPHYFAGYTGGRKCFMPGVASYDCITANHKLAISPAAQAMVLKGNPVAEELDDAEHILARLNVFAIMTVLDGEHRIYAAAAGGLKASFYSLLPRADEVFVVPIKRQADIVVTIALEPNDIDLYQSQKALDNGKTALKDGGVIILVSACRSGVGSQAFLDLLSSEPTCKAVIDKLDREYKLGYHKAGKMAEIGVKAQMWAVTPLDKNLIRKAHMRPFESVSEALKAALEEKGPAATVTFIMDGGMTIPRLMPS
ncbi:MAG TPA: nickel-dependent lactate racemase [Syntrophales bacterium]|nr:nickel-dependent lactate racemase [Syntrophobacterales bacterium]HQL89423.1 nickel-dependent lactate racemase [Syntrophales bacterium]